LARHVAAARTPSRHAHDLVGIFDWAARVSDSRLQQDQSWFSVSVGREMRTPRGILVAHFFNHQTHHRGQAHAMITAAGEQTGDTDLTLIV
jgi:uncharacterized damage-inducible protein DinB